MYVEIHLFYLVVFQKILQFVQMIFQTTFSICFTVIQNEIVAMFIRIESNKDILDRDFTYFPIIVYYKEIVFKRVIAQYNDVPVLIVDFSVW